MLLNAIQDVKFALTKTYINMNPQLTLKEVMNKLRQCELRQTYVVPTMNTNTGSVRQSQGNQNQTSGKGNAGRGRGGGRTGNTGRGGKGQGNSNSSNHTKQAKYTSHI